MGERRAWHGGVDPATVPSGAVAGLGLVTWAVLGSWAFLGWRTVTIESGPGPGPGMEAGSGIGGAGCGVPANGSAPAPEPVGRGTSSSRGSVSWPK